MGVPQDNSGAVHDETKRLKDSTTTLAHCGKETDDQEIDIKSETYRGEIHLPYQLEGAGEQEHMDADCLYTHLDVGQKDRLASQSPTPTPDMTLLDIRGNIQGIANINSKASNMVKDSISPFEVPEVHPSPQGMMQIKVLPKQMQAMMTGWGQVNKRAIHKYTKRIGLNHQLGKAQSHRVVKVIRERMMRRRQAGRVGSP